jgi:o-succinylbenzoate---CoA ligase
MHLQRYQAQKNSRSSCGVAWLHPLARFARAFFTYFCRHMLQAYSTFIRQWQSGQSSFALHTSGSTGAPKSILLLRQHLQWSAASTLGFLPSQLRGIFMCLPAHKVGGFMQMVRAQVWDVPLHIQEPSTQPQILPEHADCNASFTPMQFFYLLQHQAEQLNTLHSILLGGGPFNFAIPPHITVPIYHTYGMTETYSHIAYRLLPESMFSPLSGILVELNEMSCLKIKGEISQNEWLQTTDLAEIKGSKFRILGRIDNIINTGGVKIIPEELETLILQENPHAVNQFYLAGLPDLVLGQKLVLVHKKGVNILVNTSLHPHLSYIKEQITVPHIQLTSTLKVDRRGNGY